MPIAERLWFDLDLADEIPRSIKIDFIDAERRQAIVTIDLSHRSVDNVLSVMLMSGMVDETQAKEIRQRVEDVKVGGVG